MSGIWTLTLEITEVSERCRVTRHLCVLPQCFLFEEPRLIAPAGYRNIHTAEGAVGVPLIPHDIRKASVAHQNFDTREQVKDVLPPEFVVPTYAAIETGEAVELEHRRGIPAGQLNLPLYNRCVFYIVEGENASTPADSGVIVLGNIDAERFDTNKNMVEHISSVFGESATLDRFHGFIPGWEIPRMNSSMIANGWAINTEYFAEVLHALREDLVQDAIVEACLDIPKGADQRDLTAIKRLCTALVKLLFPHAREKSDIDPQEFIDYCLNPAKEMRAVIKRQLCIIDPHEFDVPGKNTIPDIQYKY